jgi:hypothetical protein
MEGRRKATGRGSACQAAAAVRLHLWHNLSGRDKPADVAGYAFLNSHQSGGFIHGAEGPLWVDLSRSADLG